VSGDGSDLIGNCARWFVEAAELRVDAAFVRAEIPVGQAGDGHNLKDRVVPAGGIVGDDHSGPGFPDLAPFSRVESDPNDISALHS